MENITNTPTDTEQLTKAEEKAELIKALQASGAAGIDLPHDSYTDELKRFFSNQPAPIAASFIARRNQKQKRKAARRGQR